jgi:hypothetical protein
MNEHEFTETAKKLVANIKPPNKPCSIEPNATSRRAVGNTIPLLKASHAQLQQQKFDDGIAVRLRVKASPAQNRKHLPLRHVEKIGQSRSDLRRIRKMVKKLAFFGPRTGTEAANAS